MFHCCNFLYVEIVQTVFQDYGFPDTGGRSSFHPHLTIAKMSQTWRGGRRERRGGRGGRRGGRGRRRGKGLPEELYAEFKDTEFGVEKVIFHICLHFLYITPPPPSLFKVTGIELLSMNLPPAEDGYYHCFQRYSFEEVEEKQQKL